MIGRNKFQYRIATGRITLPAAILLAVIVCLINTKQLTDGITLGVCAVMAYMLIEMNTAFALIRTRTAFPPAMFMLFFAACPFLYSFSTQTWVPLLFLAAIYSLFQSYESRYASTTIFHAFLCMSIGSLFMPHIMYFIPLFYILMGSLRSFNWRTFFAGLMGLCVPYLMLLCYHLYITHTPEVTYAPLVGVIHFMPVDYSALTLSQIISWATIAVITAVSSTQSLTHTYQDKVQTRILLRSLIAIGGGILLLTVLQPQHLNALLPILLITGSITSGHLLALTFNRFTRIFLPVVLSLWGLLFLFNLWTHLFNL